MPSLLLSLDSLIVALALSPSIPPRHIVPLVLLFGVCDGLASAAAPLLGWNLTGGSLIAAACLVVWGAAILLQLRFKPPAGFAFALPPLMGLDNLVAQASSPLVLAVASGAMAAIGFLAGFVLFRRGVHAGWAGGALVAAGLFLAI
jgi:hypothetical protein